MTEQDKQLLFKDLCARLPYGVVVQEPDFYEAPLNIPTLSEFFYEGLEIKPYLRPMSSMTTEEEYEYHQCKNNDYLEICEMEHTEMLKTTTLFFSRAIDWLNKKMFDYRDLIEKGLALEAPEGMYKNE